MKTRLTQKRLAFSFLEISIVIAVIGLVMLGIFQGGELVNKAKISSATQITRSSIVGKIDGLKLWLETTNALESFGNANLENGDTITNWYDLGPNDNDFTGTATYLKDGLNGLPVLGFNGSSFFYRYSTVTDYISANKGTIFLVQNYTSPGTNTSTIFWENGSRINVHALAADSSLYFDFGFCCTSIARTRYSPTNFANRGNIIVLAKNLSSVSIIVNGSVVATNNSATSAITTASAPFYIGKTKSESYYFVGMIAEIIIFDRALNNNEIDDVTKYLSQKWGIVI